MKLREDLVQSLEERSAMRAQMKADLRHQLEQARIGLARSHMLLEKPVRGGMVAAKPDKAAGRPDRAGAMRRRQALSH
jgi:hypothetical protein